MQHLKPSVYPQEGHTFNDNVVQNTLSTKVHNNTTISQKSI